MRCQIRSFYFTAQITSHKPLLAEISNINFFHITQYFWANSYKRNQWNLPNILAYISGIFDDFFRAGLVPLILRHPVCHSILLQPAMLSVEYTVAVLPYSHLCSLYLSDGHLPVGLSSDDCQFCRCRLARCQSVVSALPVSPCLSVSCTYRRAREPEALHIRPESATGSAPCRQPGLMLRSGGGRGSRWTTPARQQEAPGSYRRTASAGAIGGRTGVNALSLVAGGQGANTATARCGS